MRIIDIKNWILRYVKDNHKKSVVIPNGETPNIKLINQICLQAGTLKIINTNNILEAAEQENGVILGDINRNELFMRSYKKHIPIDILPIGNVFYSDILKLLDLPQENPQIDQVLTYADVEWAANQDTKNSIITNDVMPNSVRNWFIYTLKQKEIISRLHQREKQTRHKALHLPICIL